VTDFDGEANYLETGHLVCATPKVLSPLLHIVQAAHKGALKGASD
jgi:myo-inositol-1(or 4)-monophosphatase